MRIELDDSKVLAPVLDELCRIRRESEMTRQILLRFMAMNRQKMVWKVSDIAPILGSSREKLRTTEQWKLPRFGQSAYPTGPKRWPVDEVWEWISKPDDEKRAAYQEHIRSEMRKEAAKRRKAAN